MTTNIERAAEVIREAFDAAMSSETRSTWAYQIAQSLAGTGLLMPDLPEPSEEMIWYSPSDGRSKPFEVWTSSTYGTVEVAGIGSPRISLPTDRAQEMALSILAAINHKEQENGK